MTDPIKQRHAILDGVSSQCAVRALNAANLHDRPLATAGLTSYRCRSRYGWIMIGANDAADALKEAIRSNPMSCAEDMYVWDGKQHQPLWTQVERG